MLYSYKLFSVGISTEAGNHLAHLQVAAVDSTQAKAVAEQWAYENVNGNNNPCVYTINFTGSTVYTFAR